MRIDGVGVAAPLTIPNEQGAALPLPSADQQPGKSFGDLLTSALGEVNTLDCKAGATVQQFAQGGKMDVHEVMIALEEASTAMQLTLQIRNKLVEAYQEISHISV